MTFLQLQQRLAQRRGQNTSTIPTRYKDSLNEAHRAILRTPGLDSLRYGLVTFSSVANQQRYALPVQGIARVNRVWDPTNTRTLEYRTLDWLRQVDPNPQGGTPTIYIPAGYADAHTQPSDASAIYVKSTSASDTGTAYVEGILSTGEYRSVSVVMTGTTAVNVSSAISTWAQITKFYLSTAAVGTVTLNEDSGVGTELARITIGKSRGQYFALLLEPLPSGVVTYSCDVLHGIPDMANDTDEPLVPEDFHDLLIDLAEIKELRKQDDPERWRMLRESVAENTRTLLTFIKAHPDYRPRLGRPDPGFSRFGNWFPADVE